METRQPTIEDLDFTNFLDAGALLRPSPNLWFLMQGPFVAQREVSAEEIALFHPDFFMSESDIYWVPKTLHRLTDDDLTKLIAKNEDPDSPSMKSAFKAHFESHEATAGMPNWNWQAANFEGFEVSFQEISDRMKSGLKKAVPIAFEHSAHVPSSQDLRTLIKNVMTAPANLYVYGFWQNGEGLLGATPEVLLRQDGQSLTTMALAGTCPKEDLCSRKSLMEDVKERHEHELVAQDVVHALQVYGNIRTFGPQILELPTLFHLKTDISCTLQQPKDFQFFQACKDLHPTPALGVSPRSYGFRWMKEMPEQAGRKGFGGPFALKWSAHEALCLVAIRNIHWTAAGSRIGAGCGVVEQSNLQQEWRELFQKRLSVKRVLGLQS